MPSSILRRSVVCGILTLLSGCLATPIEPITRYQKTEPLPPYLVAQKYHDLIKKCWIEDETPQKHDLRVFPLTGLKDYKSTRLLLIYNDLTTQNYQPPAILTIEINKATSSPGNLSSLLIESSVIEVTVNEDMYPVESLKWFDIKRWAEGDTECVPSTIKVTE